MCPSGERRWKKNKKIAIKLFSLHRNGGTHQWSSTYLINVNIRSCGLRFYCFNVFRSRLPATFYILKKRPATGFRRTQTSQHIMVYVIQQHKPNWMVSSKYGLTSLQPMAYYHKPKAWEHNFEHSVTAVPTLQSLFGALFTHYERPKKHGTISRRMFIHQFHCEQKECVTQHSDRWQVYFYECSLEEPSKSSKCF